ncbi:hypothetical protein ACHAWF_001801 [Thalassiosira exigua]
MPSHTILDRLKEEIDAEKRVVSSIAATDYRSEEGRRKAEHIKILAKKTEEYELILESQRVEAVVREHEEIYPAPTQDCPICLEAIRTSSPARSTLTPCCGKCVCQSCHVWGNGRVDKCPLCRAPIAKDFRALQKWTERHANAGRVWAQITLASHYCQGRYGYPIDRRKAFGILKPIVDAQYDSCTNYSEALYLIAGLYHEGTEGAPQPCFLSVMKYLTDAANRGHSRAQYQLAQKYVAMGGDDNMAKAALYSTLGSSQGDIDSSRMLGDFFRSGSGGLNKSVYRSKKYYFDAAEKGSAHASYNLSIALLGICDLEYGHDCPKVESPPNHLQFDPKMTSITGHSCLPRALFWLRKSLTAERDIEHDRSNSINAIGFLEEIGKEACAECRREAVCFPQPLKACVRCKAVWYCGKECQVRAWKAGHKTDCIKRNS